MRMNSIKVKDLESCLSENPNITVAEYLDIFNKRQKVYQEILDEQLNNRAKWYNNLVGRYFIIDFNTCSYCVVNVDKMFNSDLTKQFPVYNIYRS